MATVGVPDTNPVLGFNVNPVGNDGVTEYVYTPFPPAAINGWKGVIVRVASDRNGVVIAVAVIRESTVILTVLVVGLV